MKLAQVHGRVTITTKHVRAAALCGTGRHYGRMPTAATSVCVLACRRQVACHSALRGPQSLSSVGGEI
jgi:hypothetical protein